MERESQSPPLSHPFEIQVQGHEPREEWQRGPAPGQTGSHRTGPESSSPRLAPSHPSPPRLAQAYGSQAADPQWTGRSPALWRPILEPQQGSKQRQHPSGERPCGDVLLHPGLWMGAQRSLLLMITPTSPPGRSAFRACAGSHIPMATVAGPSTQCEWATSQALPNWDEGETFWENAQSQIFSPLFCPRVIVFLAPVIRYQTLGLYLFFEQWSAAAAAAAEKPYCLYCDVLHPCSMLLLPPLFRRTHFLIVNS